jgi:hypothetical protein
VLAAGNEIDSIAEISRVFTPREKRAIMHLDLPLGSGDLVDFRLTQQIMSSCSSELQRRMAMDLTSRLPDGLLMVNDRISMAHSLEVRGPLRQWVRDVLLAPNPGGPLNRKAVEKRLDGWLDGSDYFMRRMRTLLAFQLWWNLHFGPGELTET